MNIKEELGFIKMWFDGIRDIAINKRNANGYLLSDFRVLTEIAVKAKYASEYVGLLLKEESNETDPD